MRIIAKFALTAVFGLALTFTQTTVFAQQQYQYPPQYPPQQGQYQYPPPQDQYQYPPQDQYQYPPPEQVVEQPVEQPVAPTSSANKKNSIAFDEFVLFKGFTASGEELTVTSMSIAYERFMAPHFSLGSNFDMYIGAIKGAPFMLWYFGFLSEGRYYVDADFDKFFIGTTLGLNLLSADGVSEKKGGFIGLTSSLKWGYKVVIFESSYVEPSMSWVVSKHGSHVGAAMPTPLGWQGGLRLGYSF